MNPIITALVLTATLTATAVLALIRALVRAEQGYEDETGFHPGTLEPSSLGILKTENLEISNP